jgi:hypothetical protein
MRSRHPFIQYLQKAYLLFLTFPATPGHSVPGFAIYLNVPMPIMNCTMLHYIDVHDDLCKRQLRERSKDLAEGTAFTRDAEFEAITKYFQAPNKDEGFNVIRHQRTVDF